MKSTFEELGGTYKQAGDYLIPDIEVPENPEVGFWGMQRRKYLQEQQPALYTALFLGGKLADHLQEIHPMLDCRFRRMGASLLPLTYDNRNTLKSLWLCDMISTFSIVPCDFFTLDLSI